MSKPPTANDVAAWQVSMTGLRTTIVVGTKRDKDAWLRQHERDIGPIFNLSVYGPYDFVDARVKAERVERTEGL
jgi:hypothetical protein